MFEHSHQTRRIFKHSFSWSIQSI